MTKVSSQAEDLATFTSIFTRKIQYLLLESNSALFLVDVRPVE